jgi:hypothetical protein
MPSRFNNFYVLYSNRSVEFLEHVGRQYMRNYLPTFKRAALLFVTASKGGGWHHVEVRSPWWWISRMTAAGFIYSQELSDYVRIFAEAGNVNSTNTGYKLQRRLMVFINPAVAALRKHDHLFGGNGCIYGGFNPVDGVECDKRFKWFSAETDSVPDEYQSLLNCNFDHSRPEVMGSKKIKESQYFIDEDYGMLYRPTVTGHRAYIGIWNCSRNHQSKHHI